MIKDNSDKSMIHKRIQQMILTDHNQFDRQNKTGESFFLNPVIVMLPCGLKTNYLHF